METITVRLLNASEIECRVAMVSEKGVSLLLYKDARVDQKILDETFGLFGWKRSHQMIGDNLYCTVEVWDKEKSQWISKQDVGTMSYSEKEKGQASDSFKRACFNFGIGRELYTAPFIWVPAEKVKIQLKEKKYVTQERFQVREIAYNDNREITALEIVNGYGKQVFSMKPAAQNSVQKVKETLNAKARKTIEDELIRTGVTMEEVLKRYQIQDISEMTGEMYRDAITGLRKTKPVRAA